MKLTFNTKRRSYALLQLTLVIAAVELLIMTAFDHLQISGVPAGLLGTALIALTAVVAAKRFFLKPAGDFMHEQNHSILSNIADGLVIQGPDGKILFHNDSALKILGLTSDQLLGKTSMDPSWNASDEFGAPLSGEQHPAMVTIRTGLAVHDFIMGVSLAGKETRWIRINSVPGFDKMEKEKMDFVICTFSDVTEIRRSALAITESNKRFEQAARAVGFGVWEWNLKTGKLIWDPTMYQIYNIQKSDFSSDYDAFEKTLLPEDAVEVRNQLNTTFANQEPEFKSQFRIRSHNQEIRFISAAATCLYDDDGKIDRVIGFNWDVSVERLYERERAQLLDWQKSILNSTEHMLISTDLDGNVNLFNRGAEKHLQHTAAEIIGKTSPATWHLQSEIEARAKELSTELNEPIPPGFDVFIAKANRNLVDIGQWTYRRKDGTEFPVKLTITSIRNSEGQIFGYTGVAEDLTAEIALKKKIELQQIQLSSQLKMASLGEMAGGIAHEINNPLTTIQGRAGQLLRVIESGKFDPAQATKFLEIIFNTSDRIAKIISGLRLFSRNADEDPMTSESLLKIVDDTLSLCQERFKSHGIKVESNIPPEVAFTCRPTQISQVLLNLLNNSFDAIVNDEERWIRVSYLARPTDVLENAKWDFEIEVVDSGKGIPPQVAARIMDPFFTTKELDKGTGLGLSISQGIIAKHGGTLELDPTHANTCFKIRLPKDPTLNADRQAKESIEKRNLGYLT